MPVACRKEGFTYGISLPCSVPGRSGQVNSGIARINVLAAGAVHMGTGPACNIAEVQKIFVNRGLLCNLSLAVLS